LSIGAIKLWLGPSCDVSGPNQTVTPDEFVRLREQRPADQTPLCSQKQDHSLVVGDPEIITRVPCCGLRSFHPNEMTPWLGLQLGVYITPKLA
jgi:hypothetical protein